MAALSGKSFFNRARSEDLAYVEEATKIVENAKQAAYTEMQPFWDVVSKRAFIGRETAEIYQQGWAKNFKEVIIAEMSGKVSDDVVFGVASLLLDPRFDRFETFKAQAARDALAEVLGDRPAFSRFILPVFDVKISKMMRDDSLSGQRGPI